MHNFRTIVSEIVKSLEYISEDASFVSADDDYIPEVFDCQIKENPGLFMEFPSLLSENQLLELVCYPFLSSKKIALCDEMKIIRMTCYHFNLFLCHHYSCILLNLEDQSTAGVSGAGVAGSESANHKNHHSKSSATSIIEWPCICVSTFILCGQRNFQSFGVALVTGE
ncbi:hypothetical protein RYX36_022168 [Vicia faba]